MDALKDIIKYTFIHFPNRGELSKARLVKMIYLADWKSCILYGEQLTAINWYFNHYGPYVSDVIDSIKCDEEFVIKHVTNMFGEYKDLIFLNINATNPVVSERTKTVLDFVIQKTYQLNWSDFISLIYSTYPIVTQPRYSNLDLVKLAAEYTKK